MEKVKLWCRSAFTVLNKLYLKPKDLTVRSGLFLLNAVRLLFQSNIEYLLSETFSFWHYKGDTLNFTVTF